MRKSKRTTTVALTLRVLAAAAAMTITAVYAQGDSAQLPPKAMHNPVSTYRAEMIPFTAAEMQNVIKGIF